MAMFTLINYHSMVTLETLNANLVEKLFCLFIITLFWNASQGAERCRGT